MNIKLENILAIISDENSYEIKRTDIFIKDGIIFKVGAVGNNFIPEKVIDGKDKLVIPGLINCHTHTYMSVFRNIADDLAFNDWLFKNIMPREDKLSFEDAYWGAMLACAEMIKSGTTCFLDMHMFKNQTAEAAIKSGMRAVISRGLSGESRDEDGAVRRLNEAFEEVEKWEGNDRLSFMLAPHAIYTCGTDYIKYTIGKAKEYGLSLHTHLSETRYEVEEAKKNYGMTPVEYLNSIGFFDVNTVAAHCVHLQEEDFKILKEKNVNIALNPISNMKLGNGFAPVLKMFESGINICIGTDSAASNNSLNLFSDMNATALIHKGTNENAQAIDAFEVFKAATINGAKALSINAGQIKEGKAADLAILDLNCPQLRPMNNLMAALSYSANGSEVETVIINGEIVMENKKLCFIDEAEIYENVEKISQKIK